MRRSQRLWIVVVTLLLALGASGLIAGCGQRSAPVVRVIPADTQYDHPVTTTVTGVKPGRRVSLRLTSRSADGVLWSSSAVFTADRHGRVSTAATPVSGDYSRADPMGLVESLSPGALGQHFARPTPWTMTMQVLVNGKATAKTTFTREIPSSASITETTEQLATSGVSGTLYLPARPSSPPRAAVVVFGGSEGGLSTTTEASTLAAHGFPALALAYFHAPSLPRSLRQIPLEYFAAAAKLLAKQPGVDPKQLVLWGISRGSEAALLTAAYYPELIHGVIGSVPGSEAFGGLPNGIGAAWTFDGKDLASAPFTDSVSPQPNSPAAIPVERIRGPILLVCGGQDLVWDSCAHVDAIRARMTRHGSRFAATVLRYPKAGHFVGGMIPYIPSTISTGVTATGRMLPAGGTFTADQAARADAWPRVLTFLEDENG